MSLILLIIGALAALAMTFLFPMLALLLSSVRKNAPTQHDALPVCSIAVLIPAHNEEHSLAETLSSIQAAITRLSEVSGAKVAIWVGCDGCSDGTAAVARAHGASVVEHTRCSGKWAMLRDLVERVPDTEWVVLADCGITWDAGFLAALVERCRDGSCMGVAPAYQNLRGSVVERLLWRIERWIKRLETAVGGPISLHGATVAYRQAELRAALDYLGVGPWLNDDVVLPLTMRALYPRLRISYAADLIVHDRPHTGTGPLPVQLQRREFTRRRRMVLGNVQWIRGLLFKAWSNNSVVGVLAMRRLFRLLWAYWLILLLISIVMLSISTVMNVNDASAALISVGALMAGTVGAYLLTRRSSVGRAISHLGDSAGASLLAPYYFFRDVLWRDGRSFEWR